MAHDQAPTVLVVEDDAGIQDLLHEILVDEGYRVLRATDGVRGFDLAAADRPAVILLDTGRSLASGVDLLARLRQDRSTTDIPVIALAWPASLVEDGPDGLAARIEKPFDLDVLLEQVGRLAARQGSTATACTAADGTG
jgi:DNA-binding response OmpR family regulator